MSTYLQVGLVNTNEPVFVRYRKNSIVPTETFSIDLNNPTADFKLKYITVSVNGEALVSIETGPTTGLVTRYVMDLCKVNGTLIIPVNPGLTVTTSDVVRCNCLNNDVSDINFSVTLQGE